MERLKVIVYKKQGAVNDGTAYIVGANGQPAKGLGISVVYGQKSWADEALREYKKKLKRRV